MNQQQLVNEVTKGIVERARFGNPDAGVRAMIAAVKKIKTGLGDLERAMDVINREVPGAGTGLEYMSGGAFVRQTGAELGRLVRSTQKELIRREKLERQGKPYYAHPVR